MSANVSKITVILDAAQATASASKIEQSFKGVERAAQSAGVGATAGMNSVERATKGAAVSQVQLEQIYKNVVASQGAESVAAKALAAELAGQTAATTVAATTQTVMAGATEKTAEGFSRLTSRINVGRGALAGYDAAIEGVVRAAGGIQLGWAIAIGLAAALLPKILDLVSAKRQLVEIDEKQVAIDAIAAQLSGDNTRVQADLITGFQNIISVQAQYTKDKKELVSQLHALETQGKVVGEVIEVDGKFMRIGAQTAGELQGRISTLNKSLEDQEKVLKPSIESLKVIGHMYGLNTDGLIELGNKLHLFGRTQDEITKNQAFFREQINADLPALEALGSALIKDTNRMVDLERAAWAAVFAIRQIPDAKLNLGGFQAPGDANDRLRQGAATAVIAADKLGQTLSDDQIFNALRPELEAVRKQFLDNAAAIGNNQAETKALFNTYISQLDPMYQQWIARLKTVNDNMGVFSDKNKDAERQAKALADTTRKLSQEAELAQIKIQMEGLDERQALVRKDFEFRREELARLNQATGQNLHALNVMEMEALVDIAAERAKLLTEDNLKRFQYLEKQREDRQKMQDAEIKDLRTHMARQRQVRDEMQQKAIEDQDKLDRAARSDRPGRATEQAEQLAADAAELNRIRIAFGQASAAGQAFDDMLEGLGAGGVANLQLVGQSISALATEIFSVGNLAQGLGNILGSAFEAAISGTEDFGHALLKAVLSFIAQIAQQFGSMFILIGSGLIWLGWPGGGALIGYGIALLALSGVLRGLSNKLGQSEKKPEGAGAVSAGSSSGGSSPRTPPTSVISFPTSQGASSGGMMVSLTVDRNMAKDLIEGKELVMMADLRGHGSKSSEVRRSVRKMSKQVA